jgi:hypothetical protein
MEQFPAMEWRMSSKPSNFRKSDVKRSVEAAKSAGLEVARIEVHGSKFALIIRDPSTALEDAELDKAEQIIL